MWAGCARGISKPDPERPRLVFGGNFGSDEAASSAIVWNRNFDALAEHFHVVAFDKLGQGHTDNPPDDDYTMNAAVQHANGFIRTLGLSDVHLAGHSRGGYLVCRLTLEQPDLVASCTIVDSNTCAPGRGLNDVVHAGAPRPRLGVNARNGSTSTTPSARTTSTTPFSMPRWRWRAFPSTANRPQDGRRGSQDQNVPARSGEGQVGDVRLDPRPRHGQADPDRLGRNDPTAPLEQGYALFDLIAATEPRCQLQIINRAGHHSFREQPEIFNEMLRGFIQAL